MKHDNITKKVKKESNAVPELANRKKTVLLFLARTGNVNIYQISEDCGLRYSTAHSSVKSLEKEGLVRLYSAVKNEKGVTATLYGLTTKGLHRSIFDLPTWHEKTLIAEKWESLLNPNVLEWMRFIEALGDSKAEEMVNSQIGSFLNYSNDLGFFVDVIDDLFFDAILATMIDFVDSYTTVMQTLTSFPRIKERLPRLLEEDIKWQEEDLERRKKIKAEIEKL